MSLRAYARKQPGCRTLIDEIYGIGELTSVTILAELGDARRFQNSRDAVRYSGLDITVHQSDQPAVPRASLPPRAIQRCAGRSMRPRKPRGARAAPTASTTSTAAQRIGGNRACIAIARKLLKRSYHLLRGLGDTALDPVAS